MEVHHRVQFVKDFTFCIGRNQVILRRSVNVLNYWNMISSSICKSCPNCKLDTMEKQGIIEISSYSSKCYVSVILNDSKTTFSRKGADATFRAFLYYFL